MSRKATDWAWDQQLKPHLKLVLLTIADRADAENECFPKISTIAQDTCQSERSVKRQLSELVELKIIEDTGKRKGRTNKTKVWRLIGCNGDTQSHLNGDTESQLNDDNLSPLGIKSGHTVPFKGDTQSPLNGDTESPSYIEPSIKEPVNGTSLVSAEQNSADLSQAEKTRQIFDSYVSGMKVTYGENINPVRNQTINSQLVKLLDRVGFENAKQVAFWYPQHQNAFYVQTVHAIGPMLKDCESLLIQVQSGRMVTRSEAYQADKSGHFKSSISQRNPEDQEVF